MLQYLIILLDDTSVPYCQYSNPKTKRRLISPEHLKAGILYGMKENMMIQFIYPDYKLPLGYESIIETIDHINIKPSKCSEGADVIVFDNWNEWRNRLWEKEKVYVLRTGKKELFANYRQIGACLPEITRLNLVITDLDTFTEADFEVYKEMLSDLSDVLAISYGQGGMPQLNLLTDRMALDKMNNCNAGLENITLAPNGKFYICPAFYMEDEAGSIGSPVEGLDIRNPQLYKLAYAPLCRKCDAYQCRRCIYLNRKTTNEVNTPSHEQCVMAHIERNASRDLLASIRKNRTFLPDKEIKEITYLDPFEIKEEL